MVFHIKNYALHGLISHRDHSNVNHISSLILSNTCIKTLIYRSIAQRYYKNLQYKIEEKDKTSYWASIHRKREVSRKVSSKPCKCGDVAKGYPDMWVE
jgi:predicted solute-binding protein